MVLSFIFATLCLRISTPAALAEAAFGPIQPLVTNVFQARQAGLAAEETRSLNLEGSIQGVFPQRSLVIIQDGTGTAGIQLDLERFALKAGQRVRIVGSARFWRGRISLLPMRLDNDGLHLLWEVAGTMHLTRGMHSIQVQYFQRSGGSALSVSWLWPGRKPEPVPPEALFHLLRTNGAPAAYSPGLAYHYYEGAWDALPNFNLLKPIKTGVLDSFRLPALDRTEYDALRFEGFLQVPESGVCTFHLASNDGSRLLVGGNQARVEVIEDHEPPKHEEPRQLTLGQQLSSEDEYAWMSAQGLLSFARRTDQGWDAEIRSESGRLTLCIEGAADLRLEAFLGRPVRVTGYCQHALNTEGDRVAGLLLVPSPSNVRIEEGLGSPPEIRGKAVPADPPLLTSASQVRDLRPLEAARSYPVRLRGIITQRFGLSRGVIQDATSGIYFIFTNAPNPGLVVGSFCELEGVTHPGEFAPVVRASAAILLGEGQFPAPLHPDYAQLIGGSVDHQWVEIQGMVSEILPGGEFRIAIKGGRIRVGFTDRPNPERLAGLSNSIVRVRGCALAWFNKSRQIIGDVFIAVPSITFLALEQPVPAAPSDVPFQRIAELNQFDPGMNGVRRAAVRAQVTYCSDNTIYLMQENNGLRVLPRDKPALTRGDIVEATGLMELAGHLPILREAIVQRTGHAPLPEPQRVPLTRIFEGKLDTCRVEIGARLISSRPSQGGLILQLESELRGIEAYSPSNAAPRAIPPPGSDLAVRGIVSRQELPGRPGLDSHVLLIASPEDIICLKQPPRWTLQHALLAIAVLAVAVLAAALWIAALRRTVERRSAALRVEMNERREAEVSLQALQTQAALEAQRARIARNIHDDLGARATKITRLAGRVRVSGPNAAQDLEDIASTSRQMVEALDETVWTVNPANDSLARVGDYIAHFAEDFFRGTGMRCELDIPLDLPDHPVSAEYRYSLFLLVKECLNNALKHSAASAVFLKMTLRQNLLEVIVRDDGHGFTADSPSAGNGVASMKARAEGLRGRLELKTDPGHGTMVRLTLPLAEDQAPTANTPSHHAKSQA